MQAVGALVLGAILLLVSCPLLGLLLTIGPGRDEPRRPTWVTPSPYGAPGRTGGPR